MCHKCNALTVAHSPCGNSLDQLCSSCIIHHRWVERLLVQHEVNAGVAAVRFCHVHRHILHSRLQKIHLLRAKCSVAATGYQMQWTTIARSDLNGCCAAVTCRTHLMVPPSMASSGMTLKASPALTVVTEMTPDASGDVSREMSVWGRGTGMLLQRA